MSVITPSSFFTIVKLYKNSFKQGRNYTTSKGESTVCLELTLWNKPLGLSSFNPISKLSAFERNMLKLTPRARSIIIGLILSDGWMQKRGHWNPRLGFKQSVINFPYIWCVYNELAYLCSGPLYNSKTIKRGKKFYGLNFQTRQLECLIEVFNLFYVVVKGKPIKTVKPDLIHYMDYIALAHWIQGDGSKLNQGVTICTNNFSLKEIVLLINILIIKFNINPTIHKQNGNYRIYINKSDLNKIRPHVLPYFEKHFLYKIT